MKPIGWSVKLVFALQHLHVTPIRSNVAYNCANQPRNGGGGFEKKTAFVASRNLQIHRTQNPSH